MPYGNRWCRLSAKSELVYPHVFGHGEAYGLNERMMLDEQKRSDPSLETVDLTGLTHWHETSTEWFRAGNNKEQCYGRRWSFDADY